MRSVQHFAVCSVHYMLLSTTDIKSNIIQVYYATHFTAEELIFILLILLTQSIPRGIYFSKIKSSECTAV